MPEIVPVVAEAICVTSDDDLLSVVSGVGLSGSHTNSYSARAYEKRCKNQAGPDDGSRLGGPKRGAHGSECPTGPREAGATQGRPSATTPTKSTPL